MAFDGFVTKKIISELNNYLIGAKVNKIYEPTKTEIIIGVYNNGVNYALDLCANPELCKISLTTHSKPNPQNALNFCMLLRKYLIGGRITSISNFDLERTIEIQFECYNDLNDLVKRKLFIEIMARQSNVILTNENNIIIDTLRRCDTISRELLPAHEYQFASITKSSFINNNSFDDFYSNYKNQTTSSITSFLCNYYIGFSKPLVNETLNYLTIKDDSSSKDDFMKIYNYFKNLINNISTNKVFLKAINNEKDYTIFYDDSINNSLNNDILNCSNFFIDDFYYNKEENIIFTNSRNNLLKIVSSALKKVCKKLENINAKLEECNNMDKLRLYGELLTANLYKISNQSNSSSIELENYYDNNNLITIPLDKKINIQKNIEKYFKKYNKLKNALTIVSKQKIDAEKELDYIESIVFSLSNAKTTHDINEVYEEIAENITTKKEIYKKKNNKQKIKPKDNKTTLDSITLDGYQIYIGKNNLQNDYLSLKFANPNDIWFHTQKIHGSHVLLRNEKNLSLDDIPENVLFNCAKLAKENSKASDALNVSVDYCLAKFVKKTSGAKPGMVIYNNFKTIIVK